MEKLQDDRPPPSRRTTVAPIALPARWRRDGEFSTGIRLASSINMRALVLNGALAGDEGLGPIEEALTSDLAASGCTCERIHLRDVLITYCKGCFDCWVKTPGICATRDGACVVTRAFACSDLVALLSPITFGGYSSELKKALYRSIGIVSPFFARFDGEVHHRPRYAHHPALLAVGVSE